MSTSRCPRAALRRSAFVLALASAAMASPGYAQEGACRLLSGTTVLSYITLAGGGRITYLSNPRIGCDDGVRIFADSAVAFSDQNMSHLMGNVRYSDATRELRSDDARYFSRLARLQASGNVFVRDTVQGSEIENGDLVYLRRSNFREEEQITVTTGPDGVRPRARLYMKAAVADPSAADTTVEAAAPALDSTILGETVPDSTVPDSLFPDSPVLDSTVLDSMVLDSVNGEPTAPDPTIRAQSPAEAPAEAPEASATPADTVQEPYLVEGDRLFLQGDEFFRAAGSVSIERDSLHAYGDSVEYDQVAGRMLVQGSAHIQGANYDLTGRTINLAMPGGEVRTVRAVREAVLTAEDLRLTAPVIRLFVSGGDLDQLVATPLRTNEVEDGPEATTIPDEAPGESARPIAVAEDFRLTADSLEVIAPRNALDRIFASGSARGETTARDSLNVDLLPEVARRDWIQGDSVLAVFTRPETAEVPDTGQARYRLDRLVATGNASSLYRLLPSDSSVRPGVDPPAVHYVTGSKITVVMRQGDVDRMDVLGPAHGWHLEPEGRRARADSTVASDSTSADSTAADSAAADSTSAAAAGADSSAAGTGAIGPGTTLVPVAARIREGRSMDTISMSDTDAVVRPSASGEPRSVPASGEGAPAPPREARMRDAGRRDHR